ncbi:MAG: nitric oxide synthase [Anaerolineae bacterium]|nr:nitric oxide synthase [Anaerolineae bacterium]
MKVLTVYDSYFGNTEKIAHAIGNALDAQGDVEVLRVGKVKLEQVTGLELLIVGSPTRGFRPSTPIARFLKGIARNGLVGVKVAAFDTRFSASDVESRVLRTLMNAFGYAARPIADRLARVDGELMIPPEGFIVVDTEGPLREGELERAADWARRIVAGKDL